MKHIINHKGHEVTVTEKGVSSKNFRNVTCEYHIEKQMKKMEVTIDLLNEIDALRRGKNWFHNNKPEKQVEPMKKENLKGVYAEIADLYDFA